MNEQLKFLARSIAKNHKNIILISNAQDIHEVVASRIAEVENPLLVYHNHAFPSTQLQQKYPSQFGEVVHLMRNKTSYWGTQNNSLIFKPLNEQNFIGVIFNYGSTEKCKELASNHPHTYFESELIGKIKTNYPKGMAPSSGYLTKKLYSSLIDEGYNIYSLGFNLSTEYTNKGWQGHAWDFEKDELHTDFKNGLLISLEDHTLNIKRKIFTQKINQHN
jgi:hypothetical protein